MNLKFEKALVLHFALFIATPSGILTYPGMQPTRKVAVVGGGIIGVSSALRAIETVPGIEVTIIAERLTPNTTGDGSAGIVAEPYLFGNDLSRSRSWMYKTYDFLLDILKSEECLDCGVGLLPYYKLFEDPFEPSDFADIYLEYRNMSKKELALFPSKYKYGISVRTLYGECTKLLPLLMKRFINKGGKIIQRKLENLDELAGKYDIVINCPGVEAARLVSDPNVFPIRGQTIRVHAPWIKQGVSSGSYYVIQNSEEVVCGSTHQKGDWNRKVDPVDTADLWRGCLSLTPSLKKAKILREKVELRPGRSEPRLEKEILSTKYGKLKVIHNYGHGGSGVSLFWGSAIQAVNLLEEFLSTASGLAKL